MQGSVFQQWFSSPLVRQRVVNKLFMGRKQSAVALNSTTLEANTALEEHFGQDVTVVKEKVLTSLWAGYGTITQLTVKTNNDGSNHSVIVKRVNPPPGDGVSHDRKVHSYEVEAFFYQQVVTPALCAQCPLPTPLHVTSSLDLHRGGQLTLMMTDLRGEFPNSCSGMDLEHALAALDWLAGFHGYFWEKPLPEGLWDQGCYWHLDTRLEELEGMDSSWRDVKSKAFDIDRRMKGMEDGSGVVNPEFRTVVHGDFKSANILFSSPGAALRCAAYDFQYVGGGFGMRDVAYFLCSAISPRVVQQHEEALLWHYHAKLCSFLEPPAAGRYTFDVAQDHLDLCVLDYVRFMAGWGMWGNHRWACGKARAYIDKLKKQGRW